MDDFREFMAGILACEQDDLPPDSTPLRNCEGWDSLKHVLLVVGVENKLDSKLTAEQIQGVQTIGDVARLFKEKAANA